MTAKEALRDYVDGLSEDEAGWLLERLQWEEAPLTEAEKALIEEGAAELRAGLGIPHEEAMQRLGS